MSDPSQSPESTVVIPEGLRRQLDDFRRHLWRIKVLEACIAGIVGLVFSFLLVYGLDRVWQTPGTVRLGILLGGVSLFAVFAPYWLHRWVWRHRRESELARLISRRYPGLGDRLLGVIELQNQSGNSDTLSPRLRAAAMEAVAVETGKRNLDGALPPPKHRLWGIIALLLVIMAAASFTFTPRAGLNALQRWLMPLSDTERYTFTLLDAPPAKLSVPFGEAFDIVLKLHKDSENRPVEGVGRYGLQPAISAKLAGDLYRFPFPGQQEKGTIVFTIGDARHAVAVEPVLRPAAEKLSVHVKPPAYLQIPDKVLELNGSFFNAVEGSEVVVSFSTNRPLASAEYGPTKEIASDIPQEGEFTAVSGSLSLKGLVARTPPVSVGSRPFEIPFSWRDKLGLEAGTEFKVRVDAFKDAAPAAYLQGIDRQKVMLPEETVDFEALAEDDFGVKVSGIEWNGESNQPTGEASASAGEMKLAEGNPEEKRLGRPVAFSPAAVGITPQKITLRAFVEDYFPERGRVYSEPVTIYVLTRDEHAQMLKSQFDRAITELEDVARREQNQLDENQRLEKLKGEELQTEESRKRLDIQEQAEAENLNRIEDLTERMEKLMQDSARNGEIDKETLRKMAESLKSLQELSGEDMPKVRKKLGDAQDPSSAAEKTEKDLAEAVEEQKRVVEKMQEAVENANDANRRFEAGTFVNRLKKASTELHGVKDSLRKSAEKIFGLRMSELDPADARILTEAGSQQADTSSDIRWIQEDLTHYFARTKQEMFNTILVEMKDSQIDAALEDIRSSFSTNQSSMASDKNEDWAKRLEEWAAKLEEENKKNNMAGGGGGGGERSPEDEDFEFMLRVMKMIQQEQDLRSRTRALEQLRRSTEIQKGVAEP
jgi:hypothetical protein